MNYLLIFFAEFFLLFLLSKMLSRSLSGIIMRVTGSRGLAASFFHLLFLPGVIVHELAHLLSAWILLVRTGNFNLKPQIEEDTIIMGSVGIEKTDPVRRAVIGFAPVLIGILLLSFSVIYFLSNNSPFSQTASYIMVFFIVFEVGNTMFSSKKDLEGTIGFFLIILGIIALCYFLGLQTPDFVMSFLNSSSFTEVVKEGIWILLFPIGIDLVIIAVFRFLKESTKQ